MVQFFWLLGIVVLESLREVAPLLIRWFIAKSKRKDAKERARKIQSEKASRAKALVEGKTNELSRKDYLRNRMLHELFVERDLRMRKKDRAGSAS